MQMDLGGPPCSRPRRRLSPVPGNGKSKSRHSEIPNNLDSRHDGHVGDKKEEHEGTTSNARNGHPNLMAMLEEVSVGVQNTRDV